jgi:leader peptidase (prepilin peptidase)/N-methyltransferase
MLAVAEPLTSIFVFVLGLVLGSFLNVCIYRLPLGQSVARPRSRCVGCGSMIPWHQNIPLVSWFLLRGRCRSCAQPISWRYPFVELASGLIVLGFWRAFGPVPAFPVAAAFALALLVLFFTDFDHMLLPDAVTLSGFLVGMMVAWFNPFLSGEGWGRVWAATAGAALGSGLLWGVGAVYTRLRGVEAMGMGDVKMMAMVGAFTGPVGVLFTIFTASAVGAIVGLLAIPLRGRSLRDTLPFGCFLAPAALAALLCARQAAAAYLRLLV